MNAYYLDAEHIDTEYIDADDAMLVLWRVIGKHMK